MIIDDLYVLRRAFAPQEANTPLVIDPATMLPLPVTTQSLKAVSGDGCEVLQFFGVSESAESSSDEGLFPEFIETWCRHLADW
jgi:hypothetical protein